MPLKMKYFVLKPEAKYQDDIWAEASQEAMLTYARIIRSMDVELANSLIEWVVHERKKQEGKE